MKLKVIPAALLVLAQGCGTVDSCNEEGGSVLGEDVPRIRTSALRMKLEHTKVAAARFVPYATLAALAYVEERDCGHEAKISAAERKELEGYLPGWRRVREVENAGECEDRNDVGLYYQVWQRDAGAFHEVALVFRGTWGGTDWWYGNLRWATRFVTSTDQYEEARRHSDQVLAYFKTGPGRPRDGKPVRFVSVGHSLGGGLAQAVLYHRPGDYLQAYAFSSSPVTGYMDEEREERMAGCACREELGAEARIYRFYESDEVLAHLRFVTKMFLPPNRHIHEVRFGFEDGNYISQHSMVSLARNLKDLSREVASPRQWYAGVGPGCTARFEESQARSCALPASLDSPCPTR